MSASRNRYVGSKRRGLVPTGRSEFRAPGPVLLLATAFDTWVSPVQRGLEARGWRTDRSTGIDEVFSRTEIGSLVADTKRVDPYLRDRMAFGVLEGVPVVAVADVDAVIGALMAGADDAVDRNAPAEEIVLRIERLLMPIESTPARELSLGDVLVDLDLCVVTVGDRVIDLTATQYAILVHLLRSPGQTISSPTLLEVAWDDHQERSPRLLRPQLTRLRGALGDSVSIENVRGRGYRLVVREPKYEQQGA